MGFLWHPYGSSMMFPWYLHGIIYSGISEDMGILWDSYGIYLWLPWYFHAISIIFLREFCGIPMGFRWYFYGITMGFQLLYKLKSMEIKLKSFESNWK
jgi:hypothetical protein